MPVSVFDVAILDDCNDSFANASDVFFSVGWNCIFHPVEFSLWLEEHSVEKCLKWLVRFSKVGCNFSHICP